MNPLHFEFRDGYFFFLSTYDEIKSNDEMLDDNDEDKENIKLLVQKNKGLCKSNAMLMLDDSYKERGIKEYDIQLFIPFSQNQFYASEIIQRQLNYTRELNKSLLIHLYLLCNATIDVKHLLYWMSDQSEPTQMLSLKCEYATKNFVFEQKDNLTCRRGINSAIKKICGDNFDIQKQVERSNKIYLLPPLINKIEMTLKNCQFHIPKFYFLGLLASWGQDGDGKKLLQIFIQKKKYPIVLEPLENVVGYYQKLGFKSLTIQNHTVKFLNKKEKDLPFIENEHSYLDLDFLPKAFLFFQECSKDDWINMLEKERLMILI
jgi:hypothetical protein